MPTTVSEDSPRASEVSFEPPSNPASSTKSTVFSRIRLWISRYIAEPPKSGAKASHRLVLAACCSIFVVALGTRLMQWQDTLPALPQGETMARLYKSEAKRMLNDGGILYPNGTVDPGDGRLILHPPGYSMMIAVIYAMFGEGDQKIRLAQIILDAISAVLVFLIAARLFTTSIAVTSGVLVGLSPHFAYYSVWLSPDTLPVLPILIAVLLIVAGIERPALTRFALAGALLGGSCWLRANGLLLAPVLAAVVFLVVNRRRVFYASALVAATVLVVSPITIRNWVLFHHFIPISIAGGENLAVGIADFDKADRFGMPKTDRDAALKDAQWYDRPDYAGNPWVPDGIERDQNRYARGLAVIRSNPRWFLGAMFRRSLFMLRYNDSGMGDWPFTTSKVPIVSSEPPTTHLSPDYGRSVWAGRGLSLANDDAFLTPDARTSIQTGRDALRIVGDSTVFGDQFATAAIAVRPRTDYVAAFKVAIEQGNAAIKVTSADRKVALASDSIAEDDHAERRGARRKRGTDLVSDQGSEPEPREVLLAFASGNRSEVRFVVSNNGAVPVPVTEVSSVELYETGATRHFWTRYPRSVVRFFQKNLFTTSRMIPLIVVGLAFLVIGGRGRAIAVLLGVPVYYLVIHSPLSTEYKYILGIHYFLLVFASVSLVSVTVLFRRALRSFRGFA